MNSLNKKMGIKNKLIIWSVLFAVLMFLIVYLLILRNAGNINAVKEDIIKEQVAIEQKLYEDRNKAMTLSSLNRIEPLVDTLNVIFIDKSRAIEFFSILENAAKNNNIEQKIDMAEIKMDSKAYFTKTPITIKCEGGFDDLTNYLKDLERLNYYISVNSLSIGKSKTASRSLFDDEGNSQKQVMSMDIIAETYWKN
jgi:Tfp pilus assembly protein PilO